MDFQVVGVVGAGQMGNGIAHVFALGGHDVLLHDRDEAALQRGLDTIAHNLDRQIARGTVTEEEKVAALRRIRSVGTLEEFSTCDLMIESITEDEAAKREVIKSMDAVAGENAVLTSNTSTISITRLASVTRQPERFMGLHFMNPAPIMELVELIRGIGTDNEIFQAVRELVEKLGKSTSTAEDFPAFVVNRVLLPMINEAVYALYEGVGTVEGIDTALRLGARHPMGPFQLADFIGLDTCLAIMNTLHEGLADTKYRPCPLLVKYVDAGWLGRKTQRGFYDYRGEEAGSDPLEGEKV